MISVHFGLRKNSAGRFRIFHCFRIAVSQYMELEWQGTGGIFLSIFSLKATAYGFSVWVILDFFKAQQPRASYIVLSVPKANVPRQRARQKIYQLS